MTSYRVDDPNKQRRLLVEQAVRLAMENRWEEALGVNRKLLEQFPDDVEALNREGKALTELGHYADARTSYQRAFQLDRNNIIAMKNIARLQKVVVDAAPTETQARVDPRLFIEETGKTGMSDLINLVREELAKMSAGDQVDLRVEGRALRVYSTRGEYLGEVEPRTGLRLIELMSGGNQYIAAITHVDQNSARVIIRETYQDPTQVGRVSFPTRADSVGVRPYIKGRVVDYIDEEDDESGDDSGYGGDADADTDESADPIEIEEDDTSLE